MINAYQIILLMKQKRETFIQASRQKITEYSTVMQNLDYVMKLAVQVNMPYVCLTLDVGAAMNTWKFISILSRKIFH